MEAPQEVVVHEKHKEFNLQNLEHQQTALITSPIVQLNQDVKVETKSPEPLPTRPQQQHYELSEEMAYRGERVKKLSTELDLSLYSIPVDIETLRKQFDEEGKVEKGGFKKHFSSKNQCLYFSFKNAIKIGNLTL